MVSSHTECRCGELELEAAETELSPSHPTNFDVLFDATPTPILVIDRQTLRFLKVNAAALQFYGYSQEEFLQLRLPDIRPENVQGEIEGMIARFDDPSLSETTRLHLTKCGDHRHVKVNARMFDHEGAPAILAAVFDVTKEQELEREARAGRAFLKNVIERVPIALFVKDAATGQFLVYNSGAEELFGVSRESFLGNTSSRVFSADEAREFMEQDRRTLEAGSAGIVSEKIVRGPHGTERVVRIKKVAVEDGEAGGRRYILAVAEDVTEERLREAEVAHLASHDSLTGLANRWLFQQKLGELRHCANSLERVENLAVHYIDLDGFKAANDAWGHPVGDKILKMAAERMRDAVRKEDLVARLGGDEFAILQCRVKNFAEVRSLAKRLVDVLSEPYTMDGVRCDISASIGVCSARPGTPTEHIIEEADRALYTAKREGKRRYVVSSQDRGHRIDSREKLSRSA